MLHHGPIRERERDYGTRQETRRYVESQVPEADPDVDGSDDAVVVAIPEKDMLLQNSLIRISSILQVILKPYIVTQVLRVVLTPSWLPSRRCEVGMRHTSSLDCSARVHRRGSAVCGWAFCHGSRGGGAVAVRTFLLVNDRCRFRSMHGVTMSITETGACESDKNLPLHGDCAAFKSRCTFASIPR